MNWTALVVVTGLTTLYFIIQYADYVANHRQYDTDVQPQPGHPVIEPLPPPAVGAAPSTSDDAILSPPPCRNQRGLGFSVDARSDDDDDCSASYLPNNPGQSEVTHADDHRNLNNGCSSAQWPDASSDGWQAIAPMSPSDAVNCGNYGSIDCASGTHNLNGRIQQMAHYSDGVVGRRYFEEFDHYDDDTRQTPPSRTVRRVSVVIEIAGTPSVHTPEAAAVAAADDADSEARAGQSSRQERPREEPSWQRVLRWLERLVELFLFVNALIAFVNWITGDGAAPSLNEIKQSRGKFW